MADVAGSVPQPAALPISTTAAPGSAAKPRPTVPPSAPTFPDLASLPFNVPPILLEGDEPSATLISGPGQKYLVAPLPHTPPPETQEVPEIYGTGELFLTPRDPRCLYAHWDISAAQQRHYNASSIHQHLLVRVRVEGPSGELVSEMHVHPESRHWFIHVTRPGTAYLAELGYYQADGVWRPIAVSAPTSTPRDEASADRTIQFATVSPDLPLTPILEANAPARFESATGTRIAPQAAAPPAVPPSPTLASPGPAFAAAPPPSANGPSLPLLELQRRADTPLHVPSTAENLPMPSAPLPWRSGLLAETPPRPAPAMQPAPTPSADWNAEQEDLLGQMIAQAFVRREWIGSIELVELIREQARAKRPLRPAEDLASLALAEAVPLPPPGPEAITSPGLQEGQMPAPPVAGRDFWFNINAELVIYGATEPDAEVTIGGRRIRLRPDGTFSYRFALPDGTYELPVRAVAVHGDLRQATLRFYRGTDYIGQVEAHPQDPALKQPAPENVA